MPQPMGPQAGAEAAEAVEPKLPDGELDPMAPNIESAFSA